jgi:hypothetical protein
LGLINSYLINFYFKSLIIDVNIKTVYLDIIPIKRGTNKLKKEISEIVDKILSITDDRDYLENQDNQLMVKQLEKKIDKMVYELYELTPEEIKIIEEFGKEK